LTLSSDPRCKRMAAGPEKCLLTVGFARKIEPDRKYPGRVQAWPKIPPGADQVWPNIPPLGHLRDESAYCTGHSIFNVSTQRTV